MPAWLRSRPRLIAFRDQNAMVPVQTSPERFARKTTVPAWFVILRSTLNEPLRPPVVAVPCGGIVSAQREAYVSER